MRGRSRRFNADRVVLFPVLRPFVHDLRTAIALGLGTYKGSLTNGVEIWVKVRPGGEIGRRKGLKIPRLRSCRFESGPGHQVNISAGAQKQKA